MTVLALDVLVGVIRTGVRLVTMEGHGAVARRTGVLAVRLPVLKNVLDVAPTPGVVLSGDLDGIRHPALRLVLDGYQKIISYAGPEHPNVPFIFRELFRSIIKSNLWCSLCRSLW